MAVKRSTEKQMIKVLKVKTGGITPFGALHKLDTLVDKSMLKTQKMIINAGSYTQSLHMKVKDFVDLEEAKLASFVESANYKKSRNPSQRAGRQKIKKSKPAKKKVVKKQHFGIAHLQILVR